MLLPQRVKVFWSSAAIQLVHHLERQQLPNTKTEAGKMLETWLKPDMVMVQSPQDQSQWLLVVIQLVDQRECISQRNNSIIIIFTVRIRNCGNSTLSIAKSSIQHYQEITCTASVCFLLMRNTVARIRSRKFSKSENRKT